MRLVLFGAILGLLTGLAGVRFPAWQYWVINIPAILLYAECYFSKRREHGAAKTQC